MDKKMNIEEAKAYLQTVHMNRKVAKFLIQLIDNLQELANSPAEKSNLLTRSYWNGYEDAKADFKEILEEEV